MNRLALLVIVAGALLAPATPAFAHGGDVPDPTAYRIRITGISPPEPGLTIRTVEAGARLELENETGHSVEVLGYSGEPYLDVRPDGTWQNINSPADPTAPPSWRKVSSATTVRWHDDRVRWLGPGLLHRPQNWTVPLREQTRVFPLTGTVAWEAPPRAGLWWTFAALCAITAFALLRRWPRGLRPVALIGGLSPLAYAVSTTLDGGTPSPVLVVAGLLPLAAVVRHPPFYLALSGTCLALFAGITQTAAFGAAVLPTAGPPELSRAFVAMALGVGVAMAVTGVMRLRAALPPARPEVSEDRTMVVA
ncbi:hypothetical protein [Actinoplanes subtropicus]|uniref:hypothetical protein n=1 Tax=Actinoplanes subtropicus TaxID=543632 RepID=UPI000A9452C9|nr:hypothetical protein [Actinoplanes subtropicus]